MFKSTSVFDFAQKFGEEGSHLGNFGGIEAEFGRKLVVDLNPGKDKSG